MAKSQIVLDHQRTMTSARVFQVLKGVEALYYSLLFIRPEYAGVTDKWLYWLSMGFDVDVKEQPRAAKPEDRTRINLAADAKRTELALEAGNDAVLRQLEQLLQEIDKVRTGAQDKAERDRWDAIMASPVQKQLLEPMVESMKKEGLQPREIDKFLDFLQTTIGCFTEDNLVSVKTGVPAPAR